MQQIKKARGAGEFDVNGEIVRFVDGYEGSIFDTIALTAGLQTTIERQFFTGVTQKTKGETNLTRDQQLPQGWSMKVKRLGLEVPLMCGATRIAINDVLQVLFGGYVRFFINRDVIIGEGRAVMFPPGFGVGGQTNENNLGIISNGMASMYAAYDLEEPQDLDSDMTFGCAFNFPGNSLGGFAMPTLVSNMLVIAHLYGDIMKPVTK